MIKYLVASKNFFITSSYPARICQTPVECVRHRNWQFNTFYQNDFPFSNWNLPKCNWWLLTYFCCSSMTWKNFKYFLRSSYFLRNKPFLWNLLFGNRVRNTGWLSFIYWLNIKSYRWSLRNIVIYGLQGTKEYLFHMLSNQWNSWSFRAINLNL